MFGLLTGCSDFNCAAILINGVISIPDDVNTSIVYNPPEGSQPISISNAGVDCPAWRD